MNLSIKVSGPLLIIGGAEDKEHDKTILKRFVELCGGKKAHIGVATAATTEPEKAAKTYSDIFKELGAELVEPLLLESREIANDAKVLNVLDSLTGVFFSGGDQLRISSTISGTPFEEKLIDLNKKGLVIAGTSAGASVMSTHMIVGGANDDSAKKSVVNLSAGMGLIYGVVIDQHFAQRGRVGRLLSVIAQNPHTLGIGIDEDTAIEVSKDGIFAVIGSQTVTVLDGQKVTESNVSDQTQEEPITILNVILHTLSSGYGFDMNTRKPIKVKTNTENSEDKSKSKEKNTSKHK